jgi:YD repeat-containing protein
MKRYSVLFMGCVMFFGFNPEVKKTNDLDRLRLKGAVKSMLETRLSTTANDSQGSNGLVTYKKLSTFNRDGNESQTSIYKEGRLFSQVRFYFDTAGNPAGLREYTEAGTLWLSVSYKLDKEGYKIGAEYNWPEKRGYDEIREKSDQLYEVLDRHPWDQVLCENNYKGFPLEEKYLKSDGGMLFKFNYRYDMKGNKLEMTYYNFKGHTSWETKYKYDRYDNLVGSTVYKSNRVAAKSVYTYTFDSYGNWTSRTEKREVEVNILTASLEAGIFVVQREFEYY